MKPIEELLEDVQALATPRRAVIRALIVRQAGWAVEWWEEDRCWTPMPPPGSSKRDLPVAELLSQLKLVNEAMTARLQEGTVVYQYQPTLREALAAELARLLMLPRVG